MTLHEVARAALKIYSDHGALIGHDTPYWWGVIRQERAALVAASGYTPQEVSQEIDRICEEDDQAKMRKERTPSPFERAADLLADVLIQELRARPEPPANLHKAAGCALGDGWPGDDLTDSIARAVARKLGYQECRE